jgi:hypothetical protein
MHESSGLTRLVAYGVTTFRVFMFKVTPRAALGVDAKDEDPGARLSGTGAMDCLEGNMTYSAQRRAYKALSFDGDLGIAFKVVVKLLARMPMLVEVGVWRYFNQIDKHFAPRAEPFTQGILQKIRDLRLRLTGSIAGTCKEGACDAKSGNNER